MTANLKQIHFKINTMEQFVKLLEQSEDCFQRFDRKEMMKHLIDLDDQDAAELFREMNSLHEKLDDVNYVLKFALKVVEDKEMTELTDSNNWVLGISLENQIEVIDNLFK